MICTDDVPGSKASCLLQIIIWFCVQIGKKLNSKLYYLRYPTYVIYIIQHYGRKSFRKANERFLKERHKAGGWAKISYH